MAWLSCRPGAATERTVQLIVNIIVLTAQRRATVAVADPGGLSKRRRDDVTGDATPYTHV